MSASTHTHEAGPRLALATLLLLGCRGAPAPDPEPTPDLPTPTLESEATPAQWPKPRASQPGEDLHVLAGPGAVIHAVENFEEVARLPDDARVLGLRVLDHRGEWIIVTPSTMACATENWMFRSLDLRFALDTSSLIPAAKRQISRQHPDGTRVLIARGAPLRPLGQLHFELLIEDVGLSLEFDGDPSTLYYRPDSVRTNHKPDDGFIWSWSDELQFRVGPELLQPVRRPASTAFELTDRRAGLVKLETDCARIVAKVDRDPNIPWPVTAAPHDGSDQHMGEGQLIEGTPIYWPGGAPAGRIRTTIDSPVDRAESSTSELRCFTISPLELCVRPSK